MSILRRLTPAEVGRHFSRETMVRARDYEGSVDEASVEDLTPTTLTARGLVWGNDDRPYSVYLRASSYADVLSIASTCTCPVRFQCKHGAAVAVELGGMFVPARPVTWQQRLADLAHDLEDLAPPETEPLPLALQLTWDEGRGHRVHYQSGPLLRLRPMRPGKRTWVKAGISWSGVPAAVASRDHDPAQIEVLSALHTALQRHGGYWHTGREPTVGDFGPDVVPLLLEAQATGMPFLLDNVATVQLAGKPVEMSADVSTTDDGTRLVVGLEHEGRVWHGSEVGLWGDPAHTALLDHGDGDLVLARLARRLGRGPARALAAPPLDLPAEASTELPDELTRLRRLLPVGSRDGTVDVPEIAAPRLRLTIRWRDAEAAVLTWSWLYGDHAVGWDDPDDLRDRGAERDLLARLPQPPAPERREVSGVDVLHLALLELPAWRDCDDVEVVEIDAPEFRETEAVPVIGFEAPPAEAQSGETDWLDLWVTIRVDGEAVPLAAVLAALTLEEDYVVLPSGLFFRSDRPEFAQLHSLVRAAGELREPDGDRISVGHHDLGLWAQLDELGVVDAQAAEWVHRAQALRDLVDIPRPEPTGVVSELRSYQRDGFHWLAFLWEHSLGGVLADDMGLGKTLQVLSLVAHTRAATDRPFLVVAPTSVVSAWVTESERHTPGLRVRPITASAKRRGSTIADVAADADVVVTSYTLQRLEADDYAAVEWAGLVLDEAQQVKNHQSKAYSSVRKVEAPFRLAVTGTPFENSLLELWSLLSIVTPGLYPRPKNFLDHVVRPVEKEGDEGALRRFTQRIKPFVLRRTKELVAADLPPKQEQVLEVELGAKHRKLYDTYLARERQRILGLIDDDFDGNRVAILAALTRLRQLALDPALVDPAHDELGSAKTDVLVDHVLELVAGGHRALVFSTFTGFLRRVRDRLDQEGVDTTYLDGSTTDRGSVIQRFRDGEAPVFLISLKAGGVGLTLTEADYVFVLDPWWNPAAEAQAVDRAHRIGQTRSVMVYRLVAAGTIEDKVMELKARKAELFARVIDGEGATSQAITADDIRALFE